MAWGMLDRATQQRGCDMSTSHAGFLEMKWCHRCKFTP